MNELDGVIETTPEEREMMFIEVARHAAMYKAALERIRDSEAPDDAHLKAIARSALGEGADPDAVLTRIA